MTTLTDTDSTKSIINNKIIAKNPATIELASKLALSTVVLQTAVLVIIVTMAVVVHVVGHIISLQQSIW